MGSLYSDQSESGLNEARRDHGAVFSALLQGSGYLTKPDRLLSNF